MIDTLRITLIVRQADVSKAWALTWIPLLSGCQILEFAQEEEKGKRVKSSWCGPSGALGGPLLG